MVASVAEVSESFKRCMRDPDFFPRFYERLFEARPDVAELFARIGPLDQHALLRKAVTMLLVRAADRGFASDTLERIRISHGAGGLDVTEGQYAAWVACMVENVAAHDPYMTPELAEGWRRILRAGVAYLRT